MAPVLADLNLNTATIHYANAGFVFSVLLAPGEKTSSSSGSPASPGVPQHAGLIAGTYARGESLTWCWGRQARNDRPSLHCLFDSDRIVLDNNLDKEMMRDIYWARWAEGPLLLYGRMSPNAASEAEHRWPRPPNSPQANFLPQHQHMASASEGWLCSGNC